MHSELGLCLFGMTLMYSTEHRPRQSSTRFYIKSRPPPPPHLDAWYEPQTGCQRLVLNEGAFDDGIIRGALT